MAGRTVVLPPECPELRGDSTGAGSRPVSSFFAASKITTAAFIRIWRLIHPCEFGADLVNWGMKCAAFSIHSIPVPHYLRRR